MLEGRVVDGGGVVDTGVKSRARRGSGGRLHILQRSDCHGHRGRSGRRDVYVSGYCGRDGTRDDGGEAVREDGTTRMEEEEGNILRVL